MLKILIYLILFSLLSGPSFAAKASSKDATSDPSNEASKKTKKKKSKKKIKKVYNFDPLIKKAEDNKSGSLMILQNGKFLVENNWESPLAFYYLQEMTPGIITLALGSLQDAGKLNLESPLFQWIPDWMDSRSSIKIQNLLDQTSGLNDDPADKSDGPWYKASDSSLWIQKQKPAKSTQDNFEISNTNSLLLGFVISKITENDAEVLVKNKLLDPLKIQKWSWDKDTPGHSNTASGLRLRNYDLLKIGNLLAQGGTWEGQKIISRAWLDQIQKPSEKNPEFGMNWHLKKEAGAKAIYLTGNQGQFLVIIPEKKIVALRLRPLIPMEQNKPEQDWEDFPKEILQMAKQL